MTNTLRVRRAERRLSQMALAQQSAISHNRLWRIENGYAEPTTDEQQALAHVLGCSVDIVFPALQQSVA